MEKNNQYLAPQADIVELSIETIIADSPQLEKPEEGGNIDPWSNGVITHIW